MEHMNRRLRLRPVTGDDLDLFFEHQSDVDANRMAAFGAPDPSDRRAFMEKWQLRLGGGDALCRTIEADDQVAGYVAHFEQLGTPSISYWLGRAFWNRRIATDAVRMLLPAIEARPLFARIASDNIASLKVLEHCGFAVVGKGRRFSDARGCDVEESVLALPPDP